MDVPKQKRFHWSSFFLGALVLWLAFFIYKDAKRNHSHRIPASIPKGYDLSSLDGENLQSAAAARILSGLALNKGDHSYYIKVGNFTLLNQNQQRDVACGVYNHISITFEAEGVAVDGKKPLLKIDSPCLMGDDMNSLASIEVPFSQLKAQSSRQQDFDFGTTHFTSINHNPDGWPRTWVLSEISLSNDQDPSKVIDIPQSQISAQSNNKRPLMNW